MPIKKTVEAKSTNPDTLTQAGKKRGRKRMYIDFAAKQKAYRTRRKERELNGQGNS